MNEINNHSTFQEDIPKKIFSEQIKLLHMNLLISIPANFLCACAIFIGLHQTSSNNLIFTWFVLVTFISLFRFGAYYFYLRMPKYLGLHLYIFIIGVIFSAALWGFADSILMPTNNLLQQMVIIIIVAGITAGGVQTLNANLLASLIYVSLIIIPLTIWLFLEHGATYFVLGIAMTTYLLFMLIVSIRGSNLLKQVLVLKYENIALINNLSFSNQQLLQSYQQLEKHEHEVMLVNKMNDMLQICHQLDEAYEIIFLTAKELFADFYGGLAIFNSSINCLDVKKQWGEKQILKSFFAPKDCWALRKGHNYFVDNTANNLVCNHFNSLPSAYVCLPFKNGIIGLLVLYSDLNNNSFSNYKPQLAINFCEVIQLSLTNIKLRETLFAQSIHDPLTNLFNRRYLDETLPRELQRVIRDKKSLCVAMLDLDFFKRFNDANGHEAGDEILKFIGALLNDNFRESDIACRFGGEEFLIILVNSILSDAYTRLEQIRIAVKNAKVYFRDQILPPITMSIGIAEAPRQAATVEDIILAADEALYEAKRGGRDRVVCSNKARV